MKTNRLLFQHYELAVLYRKHLEGVQAQPVVIARGHVEHTGRTYHSLQAFDGVPNRRHFHTALQVAMAR